MQIGNDCLIYAKMACLLDAWHGFLNTKLAMLKSDQSAVGFKKKSLMSYTLLKAQSRLDPSDTLSKQVLEESPVRMQ